VRIACARARQASVPAPCEAELYHIAAGLEALSEAAQVAGFPEWSENLLGALLEGTSGAQMQIDIPEPNAAGLALARTLGMTECFGCARLYLGQDPALPLQRIFGVTSFEFG
jgi:hypothetical protein